jgi:lysozyme
MTLAERLIRLHEGLRLKPYLDTATPPRWSIGYGRNLTDCGISRGEAEELLQHDLTRVERELLIALPWVTRLDPVRYAVLVDMSYNLGLRGLLQFRSTLAHIEAGDYPRAAGQMLESRWAAQVGTRARRLAGMMATGTVPPEVAAP